jgi:hypothetical protein
MNMFSENRLPGAQCVGKHEISYNNITVVCALL